MKYYGIKDAAARTGLTAYTLRYYDKMGLLPFVERTETGQRRFKEEDFQWLGIISLLKNTGMKLEDIRAYIELCMEGDGTFQQKLAMLQERRNALEEQIETLSNTKKIIDEKISFYEKKMQEIS